MRTSISIDRLREVLHYDPVTGEFRWLLSINSRAINGAVAGTLVCGYVGIRIDNVRYPAHRLAWLYMTGEFPSVDIDHINGMRADNRWENLRVATRSQNKMNVGKTVTNTSGFKGVTWDKSRSQWKAQIGKDRINVALGRFASPLEAHSAYSRAAAVMFGEFARCQ